MHTLELALGNKCLKVHRQAHVSLESELSFRPGALRVELSGHQLHKVVVSNFDLAGA